MLQKKRGESCMKKKKNKLPDFSKMTYQEEANWWDTHDLGDYWDEFKDIDIVVNLHKPKEEKIIVRLQKDLKDKMGKIAKAKGITLSALARMWLSEKLLATKR